MPRATTQLAKITHNDDPLHLGRVRLLFLWQSAQGDTEASTWVRVLSPYIAHDNQGHYFIPEVNTTVMTIFENNDPARPLVTGVLPHKNEGVMDTYFSDKNYYKAIITEAGNHIVIRDEPGKEEISLHDKDRKNHIILSLDGGTHINIKSQGTINIDADTINMTANKINMTAKKEWNVEAGKTKIENEEDMKVSATTDIELKATANLKAEGTVGVSVKGAQIEISGDAQTSVKAGGPLELEGGPMATLKGALVMIN